MKNEKKFEVWTVFPNTGRPNAFVGEMTEEEFNELWTEGKAENMNIGHTYTDPDGFVQWK